MESARSIGEIGGQSIKQSNSSLKAEKKSVALCIDANILEKIDELARKRGISGNSLISYLCSKDLENE